VVVDASLSPMRRPLGQAPAPGAVDLPVRLARGVAMITTPTLLLPGDPGEGDDLTLLAATVHLEAEGEPSPGPLAVAYVVVHRMAAWRSSLKRVILGPEEKAYDDGRPFEPFSCWNDSYRAMARARLAGASDRAREIAWRAAMGAVWACEPDPVVGALFYLNVTLTLRIRPDGRLPRWAADPLDPARVNAAKVVAVIGRHTFLSE
jgi:spore germination cell wall hydrolase CwlJ-like protein